MTPEQSFLRYRKTGDVDALGAVFDAVAQELAIVAAHLAPSGTEAEDLVQETFLAAIEHRERWHEGSRLIPWLTGILVNLSRRERQRARRTPPLRSESTATTPLDLVESQETAERISESLQELPTHYRQVLTLRLVHGLQPSQIATALGRPVATCKTQLQRGMELLRRALPAAIASSVAAMLTTGNALAACRATVLAKAALANPTLMTAGAASATAGLLTGALMNKVVVAIFAACVVATMVWYWSPDAELAPSNAPANAAPTASGAAVAGPETRDREVDTERSEAPSKAPMPPSRSTKLRGRVASVDDGSAVEGVWVALVRLQPGSKFASVDEFLRHRSVNPGRPNVARERLQQSDAEGRFAFARSLLEEGAVLATWSPTHGAKFTPVPQDIAERDEELVIEIPDHGQITGRILGPDGQGVANVPLSIYPARSGMPIAAGTTDANGNYRTVPLPPASYRISARAPRYEPERIEVDLGSDDARADMELSLLPMMSARLVDADGQPWIGVQLETVCGVKPARFEALLTRSSCAVRADAARGAIDPVRLEYDPMTGRVNAAINDPEVAFASFWWGEAKLGEVSIEDIRQSTIAVALTAPPMQVLRVKVAFEPHPETLPKTTAQLDRPSPDFASLLINEATASSDGLEVRLTVPASDEQVSRWLSVAADGYRTVDQPLEWRTDTREMVQHVTLRREARLITGMVVDDSGNPIEAGSILVLGDDGTMVGRRERVSARTDRDGRFRIPDLPDRALRVLVDAGKRGMAAADVALDEATPVRLVLSPRKAFAVTGTDGQGLQLRALDAAGKVLLDDRLSGAVRYGSSNLRLQVAGDPTRVEAYLPGRPQCIAAGDRNAAEDGFALAPVGK